MSDTAKKLDQFGQWSLERPIVGREREKADLRERLDSAIAGRGGLVLLVGEAGIGKTTLIEDLMGDASRRDMTVLAGHCHDLIATPPYGPWEEIFAGWPDVGDARPPRVRDEGELSAIGSQGALFARVETFLDAATRSRPAVLVLEDLHWTDQASLDLLLHVAQQSRHLPLLLVVSYRDDEVAREHLLFRYLPAFVRNAHAHRIHLRRLGAEETAQLVATRYRLSERDNERLSLYLQRLAEGNPLFIEELLHALESDAVLRPNGDGWTFGNPPVARVPPLARQVIEGRLSRLSEEARDLVNVAAVIGEELSLTLLSDIAGMSEEALDSGVHEAIEAHALTEVDDKGTLRFGHALVRETLYEGLSPLRRRMWHRRAAECLIELPRPDPDAVAHHFLQAGDNRALIWLVRAALRAERSYAFVTAAERLTAALDLLGTEDRDLRQRGWLLYRKGILLSLYDPSQSRALLEEAARIATQAGDRALAAYAHARRGANLWQSGDQRQSLAALRAGMAAFDELSPDDLKPWRPDWPDLAIAPQRLPSVNPFRGELVRRLAIDGHVAEALAAGEPFVAGEQQDALLDVETRASYSDAWYGLATAWFILGRPDDARRAAAAAGEGYRAVGDFAKLNNSLSLDLWIVLLYETERVAERRRLVEQAGVAWRHAAGALSSDSAATLSDFWILILEGEWDEATRQAQAGLAGHVLSAWRLDAANALSTLAHYRGESDLALQYIHDILPDGPATLPGSYPYVHTARMLRIAAALALDLDDMDAASAWLDAHERWLEWAGAILGRSEGCLLRARYHWTIGNREEARRFAERALVSASDPRQPLALIAAQRGLATMDWEDGRPLEADEHLQAALTLATSCAAPYERALTQVGLAELRAATDKADEARALVAEVRRVCEPLRAARVLQRAAAVEERLAARARDVVPAGNPGGLSAREMEVLRLVARGMQDNDVAEVLFISRRTVTTHLSSIYNKLGVSSRSAATRFAVEHNIV